MRAAKPNELTTRAYPVMTARVSARELAKWFPVGFEDITDPDATPEPSKGALIKLNRGPYVVVYWGETSKQLTLQIPSSTETSKFFAAFFREVPMPRSRILWQREDVTLAKHNLLPEIFLQPYERVRDYVALLKKPLARAKAAKTSSPRTAVSGAREVRASSSRASRHSSKRSARKR